MARSVSFIVLVAALLINTLSYCSAENVYCVTPNATSCSSCPPSSSHNATLSEYAQEAEMYFTSYTTMVFLPGDHVLDRNITVASVARLTMHGESSLGNIPTVVRNGSVGFSFTNMVDFNIYSLAFTSYDRPQSYSFPRASNSALLLQSTQNAKLVNCSFHDNLGTALTVNNTSITLAENSEFIHNQCGCEVFMRCELGCGITALDNNLTFTGITTFANNTHHQRGGAIWASASSLDFDGTNNFIGNSATFVGAIYAENSSSLSFKGTSNFSYNAALYDGAILAMTNSSLSFTGTSTVSYNWGQYNSGGIHTCESAVFFNGINNFINNSAPISGDGGAIYAETNSSLTFRGVSTFIYNSAAYGGGAIYTENGVFFIFDGINNFMNNSAGSGGAIHAETDSSLSFNGTNTFSYNSAEYRGGAIYTFDSTVIFNGINNFSNNFIDSPYLDYFYGFGGAIFLDDLDISGGAIYAETNSSLNFSGTNTFSNNSAETSGGAISAYENTVLTFTGTISFSSNSAEQGGAIAAYRSNKLTFDGNISFTNNRQNTSELNGNSQGGALYLAFISILFLMPNTTVCFENNHASFGGAIYVSDVNPLVYCKQTAKYIPREECFFQLPGQNLSNGYNVQLLFRNNSADNKGSVLYGGAIDNCILTGLDTYNTGEVFDMLSQNEHDNPTSSVSSDPFRVCLCENDHPNCGQRNKTLSVYPGETFHISVVTTGQGKETVPALVRSRIGNGRLLSSQYIQQINKTCTSLNYTVFSQMNRSRVELYADGPCSTFGDVLVLQLNLSQTCPPGFNISQEESSCVCDLVLQKYTNSCNITNGLGQITRESGDTFWVGYNEQTRALNVHPHCPFDYCVNDGVVFPFNNTDIQCANNRSDLLCGACKNEQCNDSQACNSTRYSLILGSSHCKKCENINLLLLIPFAVMGVALVFLLLVCKLTVATGTLSGLVFYANIVGVNRTIFLPVGSTDALSVFIAWINLDFGIEACFYNGMDAYSKTWLQFVFPAYIWVLVGLMIFISHFSQRFANLLGSNPVSVLATLILLSYAKILQTLITAVSFTDLEYHNIFITDLQYNRKKWLYDANIEYLSGKHTPLFLVSVVVFFFLFLPYTLLLLFGQWLQAISHLRLFSWVNSARLKPFMDSYHAPYKAKHRYWPGLLLVFRFVLLLVFALNPQQDSNINLLAILVGTGFLTIWAWVSGGVYKNWCLDALEGSFVMNLIVLVGATMYINATYNKSQHEGKQLRAGYTSVSIAFAAFIGILSYHIFQQLRHTKLWKKIPKLNMKLRVKKMNTKLKKKLSTKQTEDISLNDLANDLTESGKFDQLREPLLDDLPQPTHSVV